MRVKENELYASNGRLVWVTRVYTRYQAEPVVEFEVMVGPEDAYGFYEKSEFLKRYPHKVTLSVIKKGLGLVGKSL